MAELKFREIELSDKSRADELLRCSDFRGCEYTFGNNFVWSDEYNVEVCFAKEMYFLKRGSGDSVGFVYPAGRGSVQTAVKLLSEYATENGFPLCISANAEITRKITELYPEASSELNRDLCDYVYFAEDLVNLSGKKYHAKRNHLSRFYENDWSFEPFTADNINECLEMNNAWAEQSIDYSNPNDVKDKCDELQVVVRSLKNFEQLGYIGGVIRVNGKVNAYTFGEPSSADCFVVHVEKALRDFQGTYAAINREFVKSLGGKYKYINREEDTGSENLRKAKLSYHPVFLEEKYNITFGGKP
ncbi:MAG: phosphatidylglycerol lysyltransferase domain-containing protein [Oscillospiraceae bacterium]|nr:phosphatidylglycerol lysyltransferase domain-containing protein [Oscillospiraceae bacterium]